MSGSFISSYPIKRSHQPPLLLLLFTRLSVFTAVSLPMADLDLPTVVKRLDARYDWLPRWGQQTYQLVDMGTGCESSPSIGGAVAWVSEGNCSYFDKVSKPS